MKQRRVKITGIGMVTPAGFGPLEFEKGILSGRSYIKRLDQLEDELGGFSGAVIPKFRLLDWLPQTAGNRYPRQVQVAMIATKLAVEDAGLTFEQVKKLKPIVMGGAALMAPESVTRAVLAVERKGPKYSLPQTILKAPVSYISRAIAGLINGVVRTQTFQSDCCSGIDSVGHAAEVVASGEADIAICGGVECPLTPHPMTELRASELSPYGSDSADKICRPFDLWRTTGAISEGACFFTLEPEDSPRAAIGWVDGYSYSTDTDGEIAQGLCSAITLALNNAHILPSEVDHMSCWGPGHRIIDRAEAQAVNDVFGELTMNIPAYSIKGAIGNALGAAPAIQLGCAALAMKGNYIPATVNWQYPDPACRLNLSGETRRISSNCALINAHGLNGTNSAVVLKKC